MAQKLNIDKDTENAKLPELLAQRREIKDPKSEAAMELSEKTATEIVMNAVFLAPVRLSIEPQPNEEGELVVKKGSNINFMLIENQEKKKFFPAFTSRAAFEKWGVTDCHTFHVNFDNYAQMLLNGGGECAGIVVDPNSENLIIDRQTIAGWNEKKQIMQKGHAENLITENTPMEIYAPNPYPLQLANTICEAAKSVSVNSMWLRGITLNGEEGYLLIVDFSGEKQQIFQALGEAAKKFLGKYPLHIIPLHDNLGLKASEGVTPIYTKE